MHFLDKGRSHLWRLAHLRQTFVRCCHRSTVQAPKPSSGTQCPLSGRNRAGVEPPVIRDERTSFTGRRDRVVYINQAALKRDWPKSPWKERVAIMPSAASSHSQQTFTLLV